MPDQNKDIQIPPFSFFYRAEGRAILISLVVGGIIVIVKISAYFLSGSMAVMADMLESLVHNLAVLFAAYSLWYSRRPPDENHLYGHGKIQFFSAGVEGGLVCGAGILILANVMYGFVVGYALRDVSGGVALVILAGLINAALGGYLIRAGKRYNSLILRANGIHVLSDVVTTGASLIGLLGAVWTGVIQIDLFVAALGGLYILLEGLKLIHTSFRGLMDEADRNVDQLVRQVLKKESNEHRWDYHALRHRSEGNRHWIELHLELHPDTPLEAAHDQATHLESMIRSVFQEPVVITTHLEPYASHRSDENTNSLPQENEKGRMPMEETRKRFTIRRLEDIEKEKSTCGYRQRLFSVGDETPAFFHVVRINGSKTHYHQRATEFYYVLEGGGTMTVDGETFPIGPGTMVKLDPESVHSSAGDHLVLVVGIPDILEDDIFFPE
jgi:cation diffusion facilitator family transporter